VKDNVVVMDFNHPLAGETLHFNGKVLDVHEPTADEIAAMNAAMNPACGGGCSGCESDCNMN
jgi:FKBP-type peptidyl-prolyl cis-trans isomerase SlyD